MCLTAHFIDDDLKLKKRILNFCQISSHSGEAIGKSIERCLLDWGIGKILTVIVDNASANDVGIQYLKRRLNSWGGGILKNEFLHMRCCAHILSLTVREGFLDFADSISRICAAVRYVRSSPARLQKFKSCIEQEKIESKSLVCLDVSTRWNSTYLMLEAVLKFQKAFELLEVQDGKYRDELTKGEKMKGLPLDDDWEYARALLPNLQIFYDATLRVSGSSFVTSNIYLQEVYSIGLTLNDWCNGGDVNVSLMSSKMKKKHDKYWGNTASINIMLHIAVVLDPRNKLHYVKWIINEYYNNASATALYGKVCIVLCSMFEQYSSLHHTPSVQASSQSSSSSELVSNENPKGLHLIRRKYKKHRAGEMGQESKSELDRYLEEECENDSDENFDILLWWKVNSSRYRLLSLMAKDVLAIPVSTVASEYTFSTGGRILDSFRSSLTPSLAEALICSQDWLRASSVPLDVEEKLEELEALESDISGMTMEPTLLDD